MAIQRIEVKNFTVFNDISVRASDGINVIIGDNGTGKTHFLKLIYSVWLARRELTYKANVVFGKKDMFKFSYGDAPSNYGNQRQELLMESIWEGFTQTPEVISKAEQEDYPKIITVIESTAPYSPIFIPAKEMLSLSNITRIDDKYSNELAMDKTLTDIIRKAQSIKPNKIPVLAEKSISKLEKIIDGKVFINEKDLTFWIRKNNQMEIPFSMEAEGLRKFGLLWQLLMNESITQGTVLLWDEPEANINPRLIPDLVEILLELSRNGVQMFLATHDYFLAKYFEVLSGESDSIAFHSLYKTDNGVQCESCNKFSTLTNNGIISEKIRLYETEIEKVTE